MKELKLLINRIVGGRSQNGLGLSFPTSSFLYPNPNCINICPSSDILNDACNHGVDVAQVIGMTPVHTTVASSNSFKLGGDASVLTTSGSTAVNPVLGGGIGTETAPVKVMEGFLIEIRFFGIVGSGKTAEDYLDLGEPEVEKTEELPEQVSSDQNIPSWEKVFGKKNF